MTDTIPVPAATDAPEPRRPSRRGRARAAEGASPTGSGSMVNLLSPWVVEENRVHQLRKRFVVAAIAVVVVMPLVWVGLHLEIIRSQEELRGDQAVADGLQAQIAELGPVRSYSASVGVRGALIGTTMASEVAFSRALTSLNSLLPDGVVLDSTTAATVPLDEVPTLETAAACPGPDPFGAKTMAGCVTLSGTAPTREAVSKLVMALGRSSLFVEPFVETTTTDDEDQVTFSGSVGLDPLLLSGRYAGLVPESAAPAATVTPSSDTAAQDAP